MGKTVPSESRRVQLTDVSRVLGLWSLVPLGGLPGSSPYQVSSLLPLRGPDKNINQYGYIYNILHDFTCGHDAVAKNRIGCNADPSLRSTWKDGQVTRYAGFPLGNTSDTTSNGWADQDNYTIRQWLGILGGNASTSIIDTSLYGKMILPLC